MYAYGCEEECATVLEIIACGYESESRKCMHIKKKLNV